MMSYYITFDSSGGLTLAHGVEWRRHKYVRKEGNRYIYPEDLKKQQAAQEAVRQAQQRGIHKTEHYIRVGFNDNHPEWKKSELYKQAENEVVSSYWKHHGVDTIGAKAHGVQLEMDFERRKQAEKQLDEARQRAEHYSRVIEPAQRRGQQRTADTWRQNPENPYAMGVYNVSKNTQGAIKKEHGRGFGTTEYWKYETGKEHQDRLNAGAAQRASGVKFKASINTATKAVAKWGSNTINSAKNFVSKGASLVSNLFKKKK